MFDPNSKISRSVIASIAGIAVLGACAPAEPLPRFNSEAERQCYLTANAALPSDNYSLVRKGDTFVEVVSVEGFIRDTRPSKLYEACLVQQWGANAPNRLSATGSLKFTGEEQVIWNGLNSQEKEAAYRYIRNGGTLSGWAAENKI